MHHVLTAYSLGANMEQLQKIYDDHSSYQREINPVTRKLDRSNYKDYLGVLDAYSDYLAFFKAEISSHGMIETVRRFVFSDNMLARFLGGAYHPLIHMGYAFEFSLPDTAAEALALTACTEDHLKQLIPTQAPLQEGKIDAVDAASSAVDKLTSQLIHSLGVSSDASVDRTSEQEQGVKNSVLVLFDAVRQDHLLDGVVKYTDDNKFGTLRSNQDAMKRLQTYAAQWRVQGEK